MSEERIIGQPGTGDDAQEPALEIVGGRAVGDVDIHPAPAAFIGARPGSPVGPGNGVGELFIGEAKPRLSDLAQLDDFAVAGDLNQVGANDGYEEGGKRGHGKEDEHRDEEGLPAG